MALDRITQLELRAWEHGKSVQRRIEYLATAHVNDYELEIQGLIRSAMCAWHFAVSALNLRTLREGISS